MIMINLTNRTKLKANGQGQRSAKIEKFLQ